MMTCKRVIQEPSDGDMPIHKPRILETIRSGVLAIVGQLRWGLAGLLIALVVAGKALRIPPPPRHSPAPFVPIIPPAVSGPER